MNYEKLEKIYSETVADMPAEQIDFLQFIAYKAYGITEQDVRTYASRKGLNPGTVRKWKRNFADTFLEGSDLGRAMTIEDLKELVNL